MDITAPIKPPEDRRRRRRGNFVLRFLGFVFAAGMIVFVAGAGVAAFLLWKVSKDLPDYEVLAKYEPPVMTRIHADDGSLIAEYAKERRIYVPITAIPDRVVQAFISAEDKNFYQHGGLDIQGIFRAIVTDLSNIQSGRRVVGASTITQQVAKNFLLSNKVTLSRKLKEAILAIRIERAFTKDQILELYLNEIYLGLGSYGVAAAALTYWDKPLDQLTLAQCAYLATLPKGPSNYDPFRHPKRAIERRNWVIDRMVENGYATPEEGAEAKAQPLGVIKRPPGPRLFASEFFAEEVRRDVLDMFGENKLYTGGLSVRATLDPRLQRIAHRSLIDGLAAYDHRHGWRGVKQHIPITGDWGKQLAKIHVWSDILPWRLAVVLQTTPQDATIGLRPTLDQYGKLEATRETGTIQFAQMKWARAELKHGLGPSPKTVEDVLKPGDVIYVAPVTGKDPSVDIKGQWALEQIPKVGGAIVAMDPYTGRVLALVGGFSFDESQFDRATQAHRQPGSSFKPIIYSAALDNGYTPSSIIVDGPITIDQGPGLPPWQPHNYEAGEAAGPSTLRFGLEHSRNLMTVRLARDMGMPIICEYARRFGVYDNLMPMLSMSLGAGETTLLRLVGAYSMIANGGMQIKPTLIDRIQDRYGRTIWRHDTRKCPKCAAKSWHNQPEPVVIENRKQIIDPMTAYQITSMMEGVVQRGTGRVVSALGRPVAGKTGTTNDEKDAWFIGFTPDLVAGVFIGFDTPTPLGHGETGGHVAAPVFLEFMQRALKNKPAIPFRVPPGIQLVRVDLKTGLPAPPGDPKTIMEAFKPGQALVGAVASSDNYGAPYGQNGGYDQSAMPPYGEPSPMPPGPGPMPTPQAVPAYPPVVRGPPDDRSISSGTGGLY
jgi:penicillin-binding protein 1A